MNLKFLKLGFAAVSALAHIQNLFNPKKHIMLSVNITRLISSTRLHPTPPNIYNGLPPFNQNACHPLSKEKCPVLKGHV